MRIEDEAAAVETVARRATVAVTRAAQTQREVRERFAAVAHRGGAAAAIPLFADRIRRARLSARFAAIGWQPARSAPAGNRGQVHFPAR